MSDAEDKTKAGDRETKESKDDEHVDSEMSDGKDDGKNKDKVTPSKKNTKPKNQKKEDKVAEEEEEDSEEEDDDEDEENEKNGKVPLLDQPLQISGTRDRKKVQRFSDEFKAVVKESPKNEIPQGRGVALGEIPRIESLIARQNGDKLKPLYKVLFNRPGRINMLKRNIRKFNGFDFKEGSDEFTKKRANLVKMDKKSLKTICLILDLGTSGNREDQAKNILDFLMEPKMSTKPPLKDSKKKRKETGRNSSTKKTKRKSSSSAKSKKKSESDIDDDEDESSEEEMEVDDKESSGDEKKKPSNEKETSSGSKKESSAVKKDSSDEKESSDEKNDSSEEEEEDSDDNKKKKKVVKKKPVANAKKPTPKKVEKKVEPSKKAEVKSADKKKRKEKETEVKSDDESSEDEPLVKKTKMPPTDEEIKSFVKQILEGANLEEITMKTVCKQVYAAYPEFDLAHKKDFIKTTVKSLIST